MIGPSFLKMIVSLSFSKRGIPRSFEIFPTSYGAYEGLVVFIGFLDLSSSLLKVFGVKPLCQVGGVFELCPFLRK